MKALALVFLLLIPLSLSAQYFTPPSTQKCYDALGESKGIPKSIRPLFLNTLDIDPIPEPGPLDWLSSKYEPGQTFDQFRSGNFNIPNNEHPYLYLQPIGNENQLESAIDSLSSYCSVFFNTQVKVLPAIETDPNQIRSRINQYTNEQQLHAGDILKTLDLNRPHSILFYLVIGIPLLTIALFSIVTAKNPPVEITETNWTNHKESTDFTFSVRNNTHEKIELKILAKSHYLSPSGYDSSYRHIKSIIVSIQLEPFEEKSLKERISYSKELGSSNPRIELSISEMNNI